MSLTIPHQKKNQRAIRPTMSALRSKCHSNSIHLKLNSVSTSLSSNIPYLITITQCPHKLGHFLPHPPISPTLRNATIALPSKVIPFPHSTIIASRPSSSCLNYSDSFLSGLCLYLDLSTICSSQSRQASWILLKCKLTSYLRIKLISE